MKKNGFALGKVVVAVVVLVAVIALLLLIFGQDEEEDGDSGASGVSGGIVYYDITVSGSDYLYDGGKISIEDFVERLRKESGAAARIASDGASKEAYEALTEALTKAQIPYIEPGGDS